MEYILVLLLLLLQYTCCAPSLEKDHITLGPQCPRRHGGEPPKQWLHDLTE